MVVCGVSALKSWQRYESREDGLVPAVSGRGTRVALHAGLCPQRRPRTWNRKVTVGVRGTAAEEEKTDAHHRREALRRPGGRGGVRGTL
eukprot:scaffold84768_cov60-Phaeocystis_antarctica.AAC.4